jgi:DNA-binding NtrC family response regulator
MVGRSAGMRDVYQFIERVAPTDSTVLIHGESGTGKNWSPARSTKIPKKSSPLSRWNCAALTETLLEVNCHDEKAPLPAPSIRKKGFSRLPRAAPFFSMRLANSP